MDITEFLDQNEVKYQRRSHYPTYSAQQMAAQEHTPGMNVAKPVIIQADGKYYMCVLPACCKIDLELLRNRLGAFEVHLAKEQDLEMLFPDCELGAEPPFGNMFGMTTLMDKSLSHDNFILCQAGKHNQAIQLSLKDYQKLVRPRLLDFSYHLH